MANPNLYLGSWRPLDDASRGAPKDATSGGMARLPARHLELFVQGPDGEDDGEDAEKSGVVESRAARG